MLGDYISRHNKIPEVVEVDAIFTNPQIDYRRLLLFLLRWKVNPRYLAIKCSSRRKKNKTELQHPRWRESYFLFFSNYVSFGNISIVILILSKSKTHYKPLNPTRLQRQKNSQNPVIYSLTRRTSSNKQQVTRPSITWLYWKAGDVTQQFSVSNTHAHGLAPINTKICMWQETDS